MLFVVISVICSAVAVCFAASGEPYALRDLAGCIASSSVLSFPMDFAFHISCLSIISSFLCDIKT